jgi:Fe-S cluster assembly iron-binding protein IscA
MRQLKEQKRKPELVLRISVEPGGCHGFNYTLHLQDLPQITKEDR